MSNKTIILGTAHLSTTLGKRSPDGRLLEAVYSREIVAAVAEKLKQKHTVFVDYAPLNPQVSWRTGSWRTEQSRELNYRVTRVNSLCNTYGKTNCVYVSIHVNAAGADGKWHSAKGFTVFVSNNASTESKRLAKIFTADAIRSDLMGNRSIPTERYWSANLYVLRQTYCPAVLTENLFQDNKEDVDFLLSDKGKKSIIDLHVDAINEYCL